ncbi:hypothetical protein NHX12_013842, partial [Muraenolepis orangiensis]
EVWQVKVWPKGLGQAKNLVGIYRLCLTDKTVNFVKLHSDAAAVVLQLMNVRRCGHSENFFFVEVGRSAVTGPGEFWMQVDDSVVAQNMHESLLEAMKALSDEFRQRSKSQSSSGPGGGATASNPISVPSRRHHPNPPPSQVGFTRRSRTEPPIGGGVSSANASPTPRHSLPRSRTASDPATGEEGPSGGAGCSLGPLGPPGSSPAANSSCSGTPVLRSKSARSASTPATKAPLGLMRSISTPAPSPAPSLSSSSGHGSEFGGAGASAPGGPYGRPPTHRPSVSGSPSDYGSSDEYGSSPGEHCLLPSPGLGPGSLGSAGGRSLDEEGANYILMGQCGARGGGSTAGSAASSLASQDGACTQPGGQPQPKRTLRRSSSRESEAERRLLSKRASLPPLALERLAPRQRRGEGPPGCLAGSFPEGESASRAPADDYMAMTPNSSVCSPERGGGAWPGTPDSRTGSDYMNMSPISARSASGSPPPPPTPELHHAPLGGATRPPPAVEGRGLVADNPSPQRRNESLGGGESEERIPRGPANGSLKGTLSREVNGGGVGGGSQPRRGVGGGGGGAASKQGGHARNRPISLFVDVSKANTLPRVRENPLPEPKSPGEYPSRLRPAFGFLPLSRSPSAPLSPSPHGAATTAASEYLRGQPPDVPCRANEETAVVVVVAKIAGGGGSSRRKSRESVPAESLTSCGDYTEMQSSPVAQAPCAEQGLNYIDLDLANKDSPRPVPDGPTGLQAPARLFAMLAGGSGSGSGSSDELRGHQNGSKEGT